MKLLTLLVALLTIFLVVSCHHETPKPQAYFRIDKQQIHYQAYENRRFSFSLPADAKVASEKKGDECWMTIHFPYYKATLYCTYLPVSREKLGAAIDDNFRMAFSHSVKANGITQSVLSLPSIQSGGVLYSIEGSVATPRQFFITDSVAHFFRASLYFDGKINADSVAPVLKYMDENIRKMLHSFRWKNLK